MDETSSNPPDPEDKDSINAAYKLGIESTTINQNFSQQILSGKRKDFEEENPFFDEDDAEDGEEPASVGYRYRCFHLGNSIRLVSRTELHGVVKRRGTWCSSAKRENFNLVTHFNTHFVARHFRTSTHSYLSYFSQSQ